MSLKACPTPNRLNSGTSTRPRLRPCRNVISSYLGTTLKSQIGQIHFEISQYGLKQGMSLENIRDAPVLLPPIEEQKAIICFIGKETSKLDSLTAEAERAIELLQERRTALISAAVTGQIDVRQLAQGVAA